MIMKRREGSISSQSVLHYMERLLSAPATERLDDASELVFEAWEAMEASDMDVAYDLFMEAVELDPTNVDAWLGVMDFEPLPADERIEMLRKLVDVGEKNIGREDFEGGKGHFWGIFETRPYMRARSKLALLLMDIGRFEESMTEHEGLLELNPNDNQGMRYTLLSLYLVLHDLDGARRLFQAYNEMRFSAVWTWGYMLERYLAGDIDGAKEVLAAAQEQNQHAQAYFLGHRKLPKHMPDMYSPGSREEALITWDILKLAWDRYPEVMEWLRTQCKK